MPILTGQVSAASGWIVLLLFTLTAIVLLIRAIWEPRQLDITYHRISAPKDISGHYADSQTERPLRIVLLSDLHAEHFFLDMDTIAAIILQKQPDLIAFTGDLAGKDDYTEKAVSLIARLRQNPGLAKIPFAAVAGNHDTVEGLLGLEALGVQILDNQSIMLDTDAGKWQLLGLPDLRTGNPDYSAALNNLPVPPLPVNRRIIMAHNPDTLFAIPEQAGAIFLTGHFHGGQIWMPFRMEFIMLRQERLPRLGLTQGLFHLRGTAIYISRGLGCVAIPLRLFSRPELAVIDLT